MNGSLKYRCALFLLLICLAGFGTAQEYLAPGITAFGSNHGLVQTTVTDLIFDDRDVLWVATFGGLHQFDGFRFERIPMYSTPHHQDKSLTIRSLAIAGRMLWVSDNLNIHGLDTYRNEWTILLSDPILRDCDLISATHEQLLLYSFRSHKLILYHIESRSAEIIAPEDFSRTSIHVARGLSRFCLSHDNGFMVYEINDPYHPTNVDLPSTPDCVRVLENGAVLASTQNEFFLCDSASIKSIQVEVTGKPFDAVYWQGEYWIFDDRNVWHLNIEGEVIEVFALSELGFNTSVTSLLGKYRIDRSNNLWLARDGLGLVRLSRYLFPLNQAPSLKWRGQFIRSLFDNGEKVLAGTQTGELLAYHRETIQSTPVAPGQPIHFIDSLPDGRILIGGGFGLMTINSDLSDSKSIYTGTYTGQGFRQAIFVQDGILVIGTEQTVLLSTEDPSIVISIYEKPHLLGTSAAIDDDNRLWIAHKNGGVTCWPSASEIENDPLWHDSNLTVTHILPHHSFIFLSTSQGLTLVDKKFNLSGLNTDNPEVNEGMCYASCIDNQGLLWLVTNIGLIECDLETSRTRHFQGIHGLQDNEFNQKCAIVNPNGMITVGGINGTNRFHPSNIVKDEWCPIPVMTTDLQDPLTETHFRRSDDGITLRFVVPHYSNPAANTVRFGLLREQSNAHDTLWQRLPNGSGIFLGNLMHGQYQLVVQGRSSEGAQSAIVKSYSFTIHPEFFETSWFWVLSTTALMAIIMMIGYYHVKRLSERRLALLEHQRALQDVRREIADNLHDDLGAGLTRLTLMTDTLGLRHPEVVNESKDLGRVARSLTKALRDAVSDIQKPDEAAFPTLNELREIANGLFEPLNISYQFYLEPTDAFSEVTTEVRQCLKMVTKEAFHNIARHANATKVKWSGYAKLNTWEIIIHDNGNGFDPFNTQGQGLKSMQRRLEKINGHLTLDTKMGGPTIIHITLPRP